jgi:hypothetical protein
MRSTEPIEVPPYLCTMSAIVVLNWRRNRADAPKAEPQDCRSVSRPRERYDDERWLRKRGCSVCGFARMRSACGLSLSLARVAQKQATNAQK